MSKPITRTLHSLDLSDERRRAVRRGLSLRCELAAPGADCMREHRARDLSPRGLWIDTAMPLHRGAEVVVCFTPPGGSAPELSLFARVVRVTTGRRRRDRGPLGMGLELQSTAAERQLLETCLMGLPPKPPRRACRAERPRSPTSG